MFNLGIMYSESSTYAFKTRARAGISTEIQRLQAMIVFLKAAVRTNDKRTIKTLTSASAIATKH